MSRIPLNHPVRQLFRGLKEVEPYPAGVEGVPEQIPGTSFFPGGTGLWCEETPTVPTLPTERVMILGHDFHSVAGYKWAREHVVENLRTPTWNNLKNFLERVPMALNECFFTNAYMGLRQGKGTTGRFPGASAPEFVRRCQSFFLRQFVLQRPKLILVLGAHVPGFLAPLSAQLSMWRSPGGFRYRDSNALSLVSSVSFGQAPHRCVVASLVHPSLRGSNVHRRTWQDFTGDGAELEIVRAAKKLAFGSNGIDA